jgi:Clostridial hydrophobic W/Calcineurin-like phosphoesterase
VSPAPARKGAVSALLTVLALLAVVAVPTSSSATLADRVGYAAHVQSIGWQPTVYDGATAGTTGRSLRLEAFRLAGPALTYRAYVQGVGWQPWVTTGRVAGTTGKALRLEAFAITAPADAPYRVEYRAYVATIGWQPWRHDGSVAGTTGRALRVEAMQVRLIERNPPVTDPVTFAATADNGLDGNARAVFYGIGRSGAKVSFVLGDLAYEPYKESTYCSMVTSRVNAPVELLTGNHEDDATHQGYLKYYARCLPDRLAVSGTYATDYVVDRGAVRFIMISPDIRINGALKTYADGTAEQAWLRSRVREGHAAGRWVVVGMHKPCLTLGAHGCASSPDLTDALIEEQVDLSLAGHDHNYIRSNQLAGTVAAPEVVDRDGAFAAGRGTVFAIVGNGGYGARPVAARTALWAAASGSNSSGGLTIGFAKVTATSTSLTFRLVRTGGGTLSDSFTITR